MLISSASISQHKILYFLNLFFAGLVLQPTSEAEENEVRGSREHPLAATLLPRKKSKFSFSRTAIGTGEINYHNFSIQVFNQQQLPKSRILSEKKVFYWKNQGWPLCARGNIVVHNSHLWSESETVNTGWSVCHILPHCVCAKRTTTLVWYSLKVARRSLTKINCLTLVIKLARPTPLQYPGTEPFFTISSTQVQKV